MSNLSTHAAAAKAIRTELKKNGVKATVRSESYSMGSSVNITIKQDVTPAAKKEIESFCNRFQYGHFDGMTDCYEYSNRNDGLPQVKFVFVEVEYSDEIKQAASEYIANISGIEEYERDRYSWMALNGSWGDFWSTRKPRVRAKNATTASTGPGYSIEEHTHTKRGFQMFIVIPAARLDRDDFNRLRDAAKAAGGWYSRKWGNTPGGFAFKDRDTAERFAAENFSPSEPPPDGGEKPRAVITSIAPKFRQMADKLQSQIDAKRADRLENTPKRRLQGQSARIEAARLERTQSALRALADLHDTGECPAELAAITTKSAVYGLMRSEVNHGSYYEICDTGQRADDSPEAVALWALLDPASDEQRAADQLRDKVTALQFANIPGYFPTPSEVVAKMLEHAELQPYHSVLEPSAGSGAILDHIPEDCLTVVCERNHTLCEILQAKGYDARPMDFLQMNGAFTFDRVLMNPPFESLQDIDHVRHAFGKLKSGGRLVSVMSPGPFFRSDRKAVEFRDWLDSVGGEVVELPEGAFKASGTGVASRLVVIEAQ